MVGLSSSLPPEKLASSAQGTNYDDFQKRRAAKEKALTNLQRRGVRRVLQPVECTQEDPIGLAGGLNLYGYAGADPVNFSDPFGLCPHPIETCFVIMAAWNWLTDAEAWRSAMDEVHETYVADTPEARERMVGLVAGTVAGRSARRVSTAVPEAKAFAKAGIETTEHFRLRLAARGSRGITERAALRAYNRGRLYFDPQTKNYIRHDSRTGISVVVDKPSGGIAISVFEGRPSADWIPVPWRP